MAHGDVSLLFGFCHFDDNAIMDFWSFVSGGQIWWVGRSMAHKHFCMDDLMVKMINCSCVNNIS